LISTKRELQHLFAKLLVCKTFGLQKKKKGRDEEVEASERTARVACSPWDVLHSFSMPRQRLGGPFPTWPMMSRSCTSRVCLSFLLAATRGSPARCGRLDTIQGLRAVAEKLLTFCKQEFESLFTNHFIL
jgi:hypothetical protein